MTRTEERLADALSAVAAAVPEETLRPLVTPPAARPRPRWVAPAAAAASIVVLAGLVTAGAVVFGGNRAAGPLVPAAALAAVPQYYAEADQDGRITVRATATNEVTATLPLRAPQFGLGAVASAGHGVFFAAGVPPHSTHEQVYRFRVTPAGKVDGLAAVPGSRLSASEAADALAAAPGGARVAVSIRVVEQRALVLPDRLIVIDTATGARTEWRGGTRGRARTFSVASLSWTGDGQRLAVAGQWCPPSGGTFLRTSIDCQNDWEHRVAEVWLIRPAAGGGLLSHGQLLLRQSARYPYLAQAVISPDGRRLTAMVLAGPDNGAPLPSSLTIRQIAVPSGRPLGVLYRRHLNVGASFESTVGPDPLSLTRDSTGQHWIVIAGVFPAANGWLYRGRLIPLVGFGGEGAGPKPTGPGFEAW
jgi:hypothetical protein